MTKIIIHTIFEKLRKKLFLWNFFFFCLDYNSYNLLISFFYN
jgi:hypothetical protein